MAFELPALPYPQDALAPHMSAETLEYHHGKHHAAYVNKLNAAIEGTEHADKTLDEIIMASEGGLFNNAAQHWNHSFYWNCLSPQGGGEPTGELADAITAAFGSFAEFKDAFSQQAATLFGSGWTWLVKTADGKLEIVNTGNASLPMTQNQTALLTCDVWEHAYYIDVRNARPKYIENFWQLVNWDFVATNFSK